MSDAYTKPNLLDSARDSKVGYPNFIRLTQEDDNRQSGIGKPMLLLDASRDEGSRFLQDWEIESDESITASPNAQDYNNMSLEDSRFEIVSGVTGADPREAFKDPF